MIIFYIDFGDGTELNVFSVNMKDRHKVWVSHPKAKEISRKEFFRINEIIKANATNREQDNTTL